MRAIIDAVCCIGWVVVMVYSPYKFVEWLFFK